MAVTTRQWLAENLREAPSEALFLVVGHPVRVEWNSTPPLEFSE